MEEGVLEGRDEKRERERKRENKHDEKGREMKKEKISRSNPAVSWPRYGAQTLLGRV